MSIRFKKVMSLLLAALLLLPPSFLAPVAGASGPDTELVWSLDAGRLGVPGTTDNGEYLQSANGSYQPGVQIADMGSSSMQMYEDGALGINPSDGQYKAINIQTGTAVSGTNYYYNDGFAAEANSEYTVTFSVYAAEGNGQVRVRGNAATATNDDWQTTNISTAPDSVSYTWTQSATGGNLQIDTGNTAQGTIVYITN